MSRRETAALVAAMLVAAAIVPAIGTGMVGGSGIGTTSGVPTGGDAENGTATPAPTPDGAPNDTTESGSSSPSTPVSEPPSTSTPTPEPSSTATPTPEPSPAGPVLPDGPAAGTSGGGHPKVESGLARGAGSTAVAQSSDETAVDVVVLAAEGRSERIAELLGSHGQVATVYETRFRATLPHSAVTTVANSPAVRSVQRPLPASAASVSEGVRVVDADRAHAAGFTGENTTVVVIDSGFDPSNPAIASNVVATKDFTGDGIATGSTVHGTATAEIVVETAPNVSLVLVAATHYTDYLAAVDYVDRTDPDAVSMSIGFPGTFAGDGTAELDRKISGSVAAGIPWYVSSGNYAQKHWDGDWNDPDGNGWMNFEGSDETLSVDSPRDLRLKWEDFPYSDQDYDLYLLDGSGSVVASSTTRQSGDTPSRELIRGFGGTGTYHLAIHRTNATGNAHFTLFALGKYGDTLEYKTAHESVSVPATADGATAIGAVYHGDRRLEPFSSRGPTVDGRLKPEFVAPDGVRSDAYGRDFYGTSAAAPHAAGIAALVTESFGGELSPTTLRDRLERTAEGVTGTEPNDETGYGMVNASRAVAPQDPTAVAVGLPHVNASTNGSVPVDVRFRETPLGGTLHVAFVGPNGSNRTVTAPANTSARTTHLTANLRGFPDGDFTARAKLVGPYGATNAAGFTAGSSVVHADAVRPAVSNLSAAAPEPGRLVASFDTSEPLSAANVTLDGPNGTSYGLGDLTNRSDGPAFTYGVNVTRPAGGAYTVRVEAVRDAAGNAATGPNATVEVPGVLTAAATANRTAVPRGATVGFSASATTNHSTVDRYEWSFEGTGSADATGENVTHAYPEPGAYRAAVTVTDESGYTDTAGVNVTVTNGAPTADVSVPAGATENSSFVLTAANVTDPEGDTTTVRWTVDAAAVSLDAGSGTRVNATVGDVDTNSTATVTATVTDEYGARTTYATNLALNATIEAPSAGRIEANRTAPRAVDVVGFTAPNASDPDGHVVAYEWSFDGDGATDRRGRSVGYRFPAKGDYAVTLRVVDDEGTTDTARLNVTVLNSAPLARAGANRTVTAGERTRLDGRNTTDPDGDALGYEWTQVAGPPVDLTGANTTELAFEAPSVGSRTQLGFRLNATDDDGAVGTDTVRVTVRPASSGGGGDGAGGGGGGGGGAIPGGNAADGEVEVVSRALVDGTVPSGTAATVRVELANFDPVRGLVDVELTANGSVVDAERVAVAASTRRTVVLSATFDDPGTYELAVGGVPVGRLVVTAADTPTPRSTSTATPETERTGGGAVTPATPTPTGSAGAGGVAAAAEASTADPATTDGDGSGFGVVAGLVALVAAGLLARRR